MAADTAEQGEPSCRLITASTFAQTHMTVRTPSPSGFLVGYRAPTLGHGLDRRGRSIRNPRVAASSLATHNSALFWGG